MWQALENVPRQMETMRSWQINAGGQFPLVQPFLRPTQKYASGLPCPLKFCKGAEVVGETDKFAICGMTPPECDPEPVSNSVRLIHELHMELLAISLGKVLGFQASRPEQSELRPLWKIGTTTPLWRAKVPVLLVIPNCYFQMDTLTRDAITEYHAPFLLLSSRLERISSTTQTALNNLGTGQVDLNQALIVKEQGDFSLQVSLTDLVALSGLASALPAEENPSLEKTGATWTFRFQGKTTAVKDTTGMSYLRLLLQNPGREFHVMELAAVIRGDGTTPEGGSAGEVLDKQALASFKERYKILEGEMDKAKAFQDLGKQAALEDEMEALENQLRAAIGKGGRKRQAVSDTERLRQTITKAIRRVTQSIYSSHPELATHLHQTIQLGSFVAYAPGEAIRWDT